MSRRASSSRVPKEMRPIVGGIVLVVGVRTIDVLWRLVTRRPVPPTEAGASAEDGGAGPHEADAVGDRLLYATLLGAVLRLARRAGFPKKPEES